MQYFFWNRSNVKTTYIRVVGGGVVVEVRIRSYHQAILELERPTEIKQRFGSKAFQVFSELVSLWKRKDYLEAPTYSDLDRLPLKISLARLRYVSLTTSTPGICEAALSIPMK